MSEDVKLFDYGDIKPEHKEAVTEVARLAMLQGNKDFANQLFSQFQIVAPNKFDFENESTFIVACNKAGLRYFVQGWKKDSLEPDAMQWPMVSITDDIRTLDNLVKIIKEE
jgi:hypothetical protein